MFDLVPLLLIPLAVGGGFFFVLKTTISWKEFLLQAGVCMGVLAMGFGIARCSALSSTEHLNGHIVKKTEDRTSCCHCRTICDSRDKKGNCTSSHEVCDHSSDSSWVLHVSTGHSITVENCDGSHSAPKRWKQAVIGEFAAVEHSYTNYLKADEDTLLRHGADEKLVARIPELPEIYDLHRVKKVVLDGATAPTFWQTELEKINDDFGARRQIDIIFLLTKSTDTERYTDAVETAWLYGPKNALIVVIGTDGSTITWARVVTMSRVEALKVELREGLTGLSLEDPTIFTVLREQVTRHWQRTAMEEFEYLGSHASPTTGWMVFLYILALALSVGLSMLMHREDVFGDEGFLNRFNKHRR
jgi:hypothetical protein